MNYSTFTNSATHFLKALLAEEKFTHSYPHCWRCKKPIIFRATPQWFMSVSHDNLRQRLLDAVKQVKWIPDYGENRIAAMLENRPVLKKVGLGCLIAFAILLAILIIGGVKIYFDVKKAGGIKCIWLNIF